MPAKWGVLAVGALFFSACSSEKDAAKAEPDAASGPGPAAMTGYLAAPDCVECLDRQCSAELRTCESDSSCAALRSCRNACSDPDCDEGCSSGLDPEGGAAVYTEALVVCAELHCSGECRGRNASVAEQQQCRSRSDAELGSLSVACQPQIDCSCTDCAGEWSACLADPLCAKYLECDLRRCGRVFCDVDCSEAVGAPFPPAYGRADECMSRRCGVCHAGDAGLP